MADLQKFCLALAGAIILPLLALIMDPIESTRAALRVIVVPLAFLAILYYALRSTLPLLRRV